MIPHEHQVRVAYMRYHEWKEQYPYNFSKDHVPIMDWSENPNGHAIDLIPAMKEVALRFVGRSCFVQLCHCDDLAGSVVATCLTVATVSVEYRRWKTCVIVVPCGTIGYGPVRFIQQRTSRSFFVQGFLVVTHHEICWVCLVYVICDEMR